MPPSIARRVDRGHVLLSDRRTGGSRVLPRAHLIPLRPPYHSLRDNYLNDQAKQALKDAAGSGVDIQF